MSQLFDKNDSRERRSHLKPQGEARQSSIDSNIVDRRRVHFLDENSTHVPAIPPPPAGLLLRFGIPRLKNEQMLSVDALLADLSRPQWEIRVTAVRVLGCQGTEASASVVEALVNALHDPSAAVRSAAVWALGGREEDDLLLTLLQSLRDPAWEVRASAIQVLSKVKDNTESDILLTIREAILTLLQEDESSAVRRAAASALGRMKLLSAPFALAKALQQDPDVFVRQEAAWALGEYGENTSEIMLIKALEDEEEDVRLQAVKALGNLGQRVPIGPLVKALEDRDKQIRLTALHILGTQQDRVPLESLLFALKDHSEDVRAEALRLLDHFGNQIPYYFTTNFLLHLLQDNTARIRAIAAWALGEKKDQKAKVLLQQAKHDEDLMVQSVVKWALHELGEGAPLEYDWWQDWWQASTSYLPFSQTTSEEISSLPEKQAFVAHLLHALMNFLGDKRGFVLPMEECETPDGRAWVLIYGFQTQGSSLQESVIQELPKLAPVEKLETALPEDQTLQSVIKLMVNNLKERTLSELFIASLDMQQGTNTFFVDIPQKIILCSIGCDHVRHHDQLVLDQILAAFKKELRCGSTQHSMQAQKHLQELFHQQTGTAAESLPVNMNIAAPLKLGSASRNVHLWYQAPEKVLPLGVLHRHSNS